MSLLYGTSTLKGAIISRPNPSIVLFTGDVLSCARHLLKIAYSLTRSGAHDALRVTITIHISEDQLSNEENDQLWQQA